MSGQFLGCKKQSFINTCEYTLSHCRLRLAIAFSSVKLTYIALLVWLSNLMFLNGNGPSFLFNKVERSMLRNPRQSWILDSTQRTPDSSLCPVSGTWILDSKCDLERFRILELYSGFRSPGFRIPQTKISRITETGFSVYIR